MKLYLQGHNCRYAVGQLQLALFGQPLEYVEALFPAGEDGAVSALHTGPQWLTATCTITRGGKTVRASRRLRRDRQTPTLLRRILQQSYYLAAVKLLDAPPAWGALSGVRPTKLTTQHILAGGDRRSADRLLRDTFYVSPARRALCLDASAASVEAAGLLEPTDLSAYIGIPFCPSRCIYCSFVSQSVERFSQLLEPYLDALIREIQYTGKLLADSPYRIRTLYMGGGTPTTLSAAQMARLMDAIDDAFDGSRLLEYTVEGGRPDTLDAEKLRLIRSKGCARTSINPQTMDDTVLAAIGRRHTASDVRRAYRQAVDAGFASINMDFIAGLPGDTPARFAASLEQALELGPSNITVHTLALKKGAALFESRGGLPSDRDVAQMLVDAAQMLRGAGYKPYYLYRQKYMSGNFENVGWCRHHDIGLYNIYMMEEMHTILSLGGGGMNKVNLPGGKLERFHNPKYPAQYIERLDAVLAQKEEIFRLLAQQA